MSRDKAELAVKEIVRLTAPVHCNDQIMASFACARRDQVEPLLVQAAELETDVTSPCKGAGTPVSQSS